MRKTLLFVVFSVLFAIALLSLGELRHTWRTLHNSDVRYMGLAILLLVCWILNEAAGYHSIYRLMDIKENFRHLVLLSSAGGFINVVAPSGGFGGVAVFVDDAGKRGLPRGMAAAVGALFLFLEDMRPKSKLCLIFMLQRKLNSWCVIIVYLSTVITRRILGHRPLQRVITSELVELCLLPMKRTTPTIPCAAAADGCRRLFIQPN